MLPLSVFGALFVDTARIFPGHPGFAALPEIRDGGRVLKGS